MANPKTMPIFASSVSHRSDTCSVLPHDFVTYKTESFVIACHRSPILLLFLYDAFKCPLDWAQNDDAVPRLNDQIFESVQ